MAFAFDIPLGFRPQDVARITAQAEADGIDGVWSTEAGSDPYLPLGQVAAASRRLTFGTAIAVAFPRSPMVHAQVAWDLHRMAPGRFILGLGAQVRAHNQRRYSAPYDHPRSRMRDMVRAIRAIWECWQTGGELRYQGEFYQHTLMTPFFNPGPVDHPSPPPIYLAAVSEEMLRLAGGEADGVHVHPLHTERSLDQLTQRAVAAGAEAAGRSPADVALAVSFMVATGRDQAQVEAATGAMRSQIAFYGSTPAYRPVLDAEGRGDLADQLHQLSRRGRWDEMTALVDDDLLEACCICATWDDLADRLVRRYRGRAQRLMPYAVLDEAPWGEIAAAVRSGMETR